MNKICFISICFLLFPGIANAVLDKSGEFSFTPPAGWIVKNIFSPHFSLIKDGHNILIDDERSKKPLPDVKKKYEEQSKTLKNSKPISSNIIKLKNGREAIKIITEWGGIRDVFFRQISYVITLKSGKRIFIVCTVRRENGESYDRIFDKFVNSID